MVILGIDLLVLPVLSYGRTGLRIIFILVLVLHVLSYGRKGLRIFSLQLDFDRAPGTALSCRFILTFVGGG